MIVAGTLAIGWTADIVHALRSLGLDVVGHYDDPFELLLARATAPEDSAIVACMTDIRDVHPHVARVLRDLADVLPPICRDTVLLEADPHEFFASCIHAGIQKTFHEASTVDTVPRYITGDVVSEASAPAHVASTPEMLRAYLASLA